MRLAALPGMNARLVTGVLGAIVLLPAGARAVQMGGEPPVRWRVGAYAIGLATRVDPALSGEAMTETYLSQPMLFAGVAGYGLVLETTLNFEGLTMRDGELAPGNAGEGFIDKRHPHTYLHALTLTGRANVGGFDASLTAGRGFASFGTDDPMVRPFVKYPANHHWSHVLERWVLIGAVRRGPIGFEAATFSGNEPSSPDDLAGLDRFGDSWALRLTVSPVPFLELQGSHARVESPEMESGGLDQRKWSASARLDRELSSGSHVYALLEWAETHEYSSGTRAYIFTSALAEGAWVPHPWMFALRYERTTRPEEERLADRFRTPRPHPHESVLGVTRWNTVTAHVARSFPLGGTELQPFVEVGHSRVREITSSLLFDVDELYGSSRLWSLSLGVRFRAGMVHDRMGRYGAALPAAAAPHASHEMD